MKVYRQRTMHAKREKHKLREVNDQLIQTLSILYTIICHHASFSPRCAGQAHLITCAGYLGHPFGKSDLLCMMEQAFLLKYVRYAYNQRGPFCAYALTTRLFSQRRGSIRAVSISLDQATRLFSPVCAPSTCLVLDQTLDDFPCTRNVC